MRSHREDGYDVRAAIYARVSTAMQNCEMQVRQLQEFAERRGWESVIFEEIGSGVDAQRPVLKKLVEDVRRLRFGAVLVWRLDRLGRSLKELIELVELFGVLGVQFVSLEDGIDTSTSTGKLVFHIIGAVAEFEREFIRERVRAGLAHAKERGTRLGRPPVAVDKDEILRLREQGLSLRQIGEELGISKSKVGMVLKEAETSKPLSKKLRKIKALEAAKNKASKSGNVQSTKQ